ncbi:MAG: hypothetical protein QNJ42_10325 [Crocosphaera sp.]|nr:hypothetical protein [Crocosphaera sp.]
MPSLKISIDANLFSALSNEEQKKISDILKSTDLLDENGSLESTSDGVVDTQTVIADPQGIFDNIGEQLCKVGCDTAAAAATAACSGLSGGVAIAACIAAAAAAREVCRDAC